MYNVFIYLLLGILILTSVLMVLIVLMQRPKNEGLGASFGGGMTQDLFGAQTTNVLQKFTVYLGATFFLACFLLTVLYSKSSTRQSEIQKQLAATVAVKKTTPATSPSPGPVAPVAPAPSDAVPTGPTAPALPAPAATLPGTSTPATPEAAATPAATATP